MSVCRHWAVLGSAAFSPPFVLVTHMVGHGSSWCEPLRELSYRQYGCSLFKTNAELQSYTGQVRPRDFGHLWVSFVDVRVALASPKRRWQIQTILTSNFGNKQFWLCDWEPTSSEWNCKSVKFKRPFAEHCSNLQILINFEVLLLPHWLRPCLPECLFLRRMGRSYKMSPKMSQSSTFLRQGSLGVKTTNHR